MNLRRWCLVSIALVFAARLAAQTYTFASAAGVSYAGGITLDAAGNLYGTQAYNATVWRMNPAGVVSTIAGGSSMAGSADGTGAAAQFNGLRAIGRDSVGNLYVADMGNHTIRKITPAGVVTTFAGLAGNQGSTDGRDSAARFNAPIGLAVDSADNV
jgi:hypothetical protein